MNFLKSNKCFRSVFRSYATKRYVPEKPYESVFKRNLPPKTKLDSDTIEILEKLSLVGKITKENVKIVEDSIAFADVILQADTKNVAPVYTVLEDWPLNVREDKVVEDVCFFDIVKNAKKLEEDYFVAPSVNVPVDQKKVKKE